MAKKRQEENERKTEEENAAGPPKQEAITPEGTSPNTRNPLADYAAFMRMMGQQNANTRRYESVLEATRRANQMINLPRDPVKTKRIDDRRRAMNVSEHHGRSQFMKDRDERVREQIFMDNLDKMVERNWRRSQRDSDESLDDLSHEEVTAMMERAKARDAQMTEEGRVIRGTLPEHSPEETGPEMTHPPHYSPPPVMDHPPYYAPPTNEIPPGMEANPLEQLHGPPEEAPPFTLYPYPSFEDSTVFDDTDSPPVGTEYDTTPEPMYGYMNPNVHQPPLDASFAPPPFNPMADFYGMSNTIGGMAQQGLAEAEQFAGRLAGQQTHGQGYPQMAADWMAQNNPMHNLKLQSDILKLRAKNLKEIHDEAAHTGPNVMYRHWRDNVYDPRTGTPQRGFARPMTHPPAPPVPTYAPPTNEIPPGMTAPEVYRRLHPPIHTR
tara:strand:- start:2305 stop:3615 length:1311 start_codon:yes stop_codon:yes gene_type:complete